VDDDLGVARRLEDRARLLELGAELLGVREVAVVAHRDRTVAVVDGDRLAFLMCEPPR